MNRDSLASELESYFRSPGHTVNMLDSNQKPTTDSKKAKTFVVNYKNNPENQVTVLLPENEDSVVVLFSQKMLDQMDDQGTREWYQFLKGLRQLSHGYRFDVRNYNKTTLTKRDLGAVNAKTAPIDIIKDKVMKEHIEESFEPMTGTVKTSYQNFDNVRIKIRHSKAVAENVRGARSRAIKAIYFENSVGERLLFPSKNLMGARAMARHLSHGGTMHDEIGTRVLEWCNFSKTLSEFARYARKNNLINENTQNVYDRVQTSIQDAKHVLSQLASQAGYDRLVQGGVPQAPTANNEINFADLQEAFTVKHFDESIAAMLPLVKTVMELKNPMDDEASGTEESDPYSKENMMKLNLVVKGKLADISASLKMPYNELVKKLEPTIKAVATSDSNKLSRKLSEFARRMDDDEVSNMIAGVADGLAAKDEPFAKEHKHPNFTKMLFLAGALLALDAMSKTESVEPEMSFESWASQVVESAYGLNEGMNMPMILKQYAAQIKNFKDTGELSDDLFDVLYNYYLTAGDMPYGIAKAREGDPHQWVTDRFEDDLQGHWTHVGEEQTTEAAKPDYLDLDKDGDTKEPMKKAAQDAKKTNEAAKPDYLDLDKDGNKKESMKKAAQDAKKHETNEDTMRNWISLFDKE